MGFILNYKALWVFYLTLIAFLGLISQSGFLLSFDYEFFFLFNLFLSAHILLLYFKRPLNRIALHVMISFIIACLTAYIVNMYRGQLCSLSDGLYWLTLQSFCACLCQLAVFYVVKYFIPKHTFKQLILHGFIFVIFSIPTVFDLLYSPQLSFFHPLLGYYHGPIYDAYIPKLNAWIGFRFWTTLLSFWCFVLFGFCLIDVLKKPLKKILWFITVFLVCAPLLLRYELNWSHRYADIKKTLDQHIGLGYVTLHYHQDTYTPVEARQILISLHFEHEHLSKILPIDQTKPQTVDVYIYPNAYVKKKLIGTAYTLIGNAFQRSIHALPISARSSIFRHEMSHILMRPYGFYGLAISPALLEGFATGFEYERHGLSVHEWSKVINENNFLPNLKTLFSPIHFWSYNSYLSYLYTGSFIDWLLKHYPKEAVLKSYAFGNFKKYLHVDLKQLEKQWHIFLETINVSDHSKQKALTYLKQKPITEKKCPHQVACFQKKLHNCSDLHCQIQIRQSLIKKSQNTALDHRLKLIENYFASQKNFKARTEINSLAYENLNSVQSQHHELLHIDDLIMHGQKYLAIQTLTKLKRNREDIVFNLNLYFRQNNIQHSNDLRNWLKKYYQQNHFKTDHQSSLKFSPLFKLHLLFKQQRFKEFLDYFQSLPKSYANDLSNSDKKYFLTMLAYVHENQFDWLSVLTDYTQLLSLSQSHGEVFFYTHQIERIKHLIRYIH